MRLWLIRFPRRKRQQTTKRRESNGEHGEHAEIKGIKHGRRRDQHQNTAPKCANLGHGCPGDGQKRGQKADGADQSDTVHLLSQALYLTEFIYEFRIAKAEKSDHHSKQATDQAKGQCCVTHETS